MFTRHGSFIRLVVVLGVTMLIGCRETPIPSEPVVDPSLSLQSAGDEVVRWENNRLQYQADGNNYRIQVDRTVPNEASFYKNGSLEFRAKFIRRNGAITKIKVIDPARSQWFETDKNGNVTNMSSGGGPGNCSDPDDPCVESVVVPIAFGPCDGSRNTWIGLTVTAIGFGAGSFGSGVIGGLFPISAPVTGSIALGAADVAYTSAVAAIGAFAGYLACLGNNDDECSPGGCQQSTVASGTFNGTCPAA